MERHVGEKEIILFHMDSGPETYLIAGNAYILERLK